MKKFMIAVLAIAVLFSFAACDNESNTDVSGGLARTIYSDSVVVRVAGEKITAADFEFKGLDTFGNPVSLNSSDVLLTENNNVVDEIIATTTETTKAGTQTITVKTSWGATGTVDVTVLPVKEITVDAENAATTEYFKVIGTASEVAQTYKNDLIIKTGVEVTATYIDQNGDEQEKVVDNSLASFSISDTDWAGGTDKDVTVTYGGKSGTYKVDIIDNKVVSIDVEVAADYQPIASATTALDTDKFVVKGTYQNGQKVVLTADTDVTYSLQSEYEAAGKTYGNASTILFTEAGSKTVYVKFGGTMVEGGNRYANAPVVVVADALKEIVVEVESTATLTVDADYDWTETYPTQIKVYTMTNGGTKSSALVAKTDYTLSPLDNEAASVQVGHTIETGDTLTITVTPTANGAAKGLAAKTIEVTIGQAFSNVTAD